MSDNKIVMSPLQLKQLLFGRIHVEAIDSTRLPENTWAPNFDLSGVLIRTHIEVDPKEVDEAGFKKFVVAMILQIPNSDEDEVLAPYTIDVQAQALFEMAPMEDEEKRESLMKINGASVIISAIREQITQITARSIYGPLTLPTLRVLS